MALGHWAIPRCKTGHGHRHVLQPPRTLNPNPQPPVIIMLCTSTIKWPSNIFQPHGIAWNCHIKNSIYWTNSWKKLHQIWQTQPHPTPNRPVSAKQPMTSGCCFCCNSPAAASAATAPRRGPVPSTNAVPRCRLWERWCNLATAAPAVGNEKNEALQGTQRNYNKFEKVEVATSSVRSYFFWRLEKSPMGNPAAQELMMLASKRAASISRRSCLSFHS